MPCRSVRELLKVRVLFIRVLSVAGPLMGSRPNAGAGPALHYRACAVTLHCTGPIWNDRLQWMTSTKIRHLKILAGYD